MGEYNSKPLEASVSKAGYSVHSNITAAQRMIEYVAEKKAEKKARNLTGFLRGVKTTGNLIGLLEGARISLERSDMENRIDICNGDMRFVDQKAEARSNIAGDPVYQMLRQARAQPDKEFGKLRQKKKFKYQNNSRQDPQAKRHRRFFSNYIFYDGLIKIETRTMDEQTYTQLQDNGLMFAYEQSKLAMEKWDARIRELSE